MLQGTRAALVRGSAFDSEVVSGTREAKLRVKTEVLRVSPLVRRQQGHSA
jgi:hypothetical protein